jgi:hypothetical protein
MNDNTILRIKVPAHLYESVKKQLTLKESKKKLSEAISGTDEELMAFYEKVKEQVDGGTDIQSAVHYARFDMENPDAAEELSSPMNEAKKGGHNYGAGMEVVKEKKMKTPKDGMHKVEEEKVEEMKDDKKKVHSLEELMKAKKHLEKKINEMEGADKKKPVEEAVSPEIMDAIGQIVDFAKENAGFLAGIGGITGIAKMIADKIKQDPEARKSLDQKTGAGSTDTSFLEAKKKDVEDK